MTFIASNWFLWWIFSLSFRIAIIENRFSEKRINTLNGYARLFFSVLTLLSIILCALGYNTN